MRHRGLRPPAGLDEDREAVAHDVGEALAAGAYAGGELVVHRIVIEGDGRWERYRQTLSNHLDGVGAYAVVRRTDGARVVWTTSQGRAALLTLRRWARRGNVRTITAGSVSGLEAEVLADARAVMVHAVGDRRMRSVTLKGIS